MSAQYGMAWMGHFWGCGWCGRAWRAESAPIGGCCEKGREWAAAMRRSLGPVVEQPGPDEHDALRWGRVVRRWEGKR